MSDFVITHMIIDRIGLRSVLLQVLTSFHKTQCLICLSEQKILLGHVLKGVFVYGARIYIARLLDSLAIVIRW